MADTPEPTRMLDDPTTSSELRQLLECGFEAPSAVQTARLRTRVQGAGLRGDGGVPGPTGLGWGRGMALGVVLLIGAMGAWWLNPERTVSTPSRAARPAPTRPQPPQPDMEQATPAPAAQPTAPGIIDEPPTEPPVAPRPPSDNVIVTDELSLLQQARAALDTNPARALRLTQLHARHFPEGLVAQERELLAIEALLRLGRIESAQLRAQTFLAAHPRSSHRRRIESLITVQESGPATATESAGGTP